MGVVYWTLIGQHTSVVAPRHNIDQTIFEATCGSNFLESIISTKNESKNNRRAFEIG